MAAQDSRQSEIDTQFEAIQIDFANAVIKLKELPPRSLSGEQAALLRIYMEQMESSLYEARRG